MRAASVAIRLDRAQHLKTCQTYALAEASSACEKRYRVKHLFHLRFCRGVRGIVARWRQMSTSSCPDFCALCFPQVPDKYFSPTWHGHATEISIAAGFGKGSENQKCRSTAKPALSPSQRGTQRSSIGPDSRELLHLLSEFRDFTLKPSIKAPCGYRPYGYHGRHPTAAKPAFLHRNDPR